MKKITITYIGGGSKDWAHKYFADLLTGDKLFGDLRLYDIDRKAAERNRKYFNKLKKVSGHRWALLEDVKTEIDKGTSDV